jgi:hypothetical protein
MAKINLPMLQAWCLDALAFLPLTDMPQIQEARIRLVRELSGKAALFDVASDLAEGIRDLPATKKNSAEAFLLEKYGFGHMFFHDKAQRAIQKAIRRGRIRDDGEYRAFLELLSDTTIDPSVRDSAVDLVTAYETKRR